jgi:hypothetical protein
MLMEIEPAVEQTFIFLVVAKVKITGIFLLGSHHVTFFVIGFYVDFFRFFAI